MIFFAVNLSSGVDAARSAFVTEFVLRATVSGFFGTITQTLRHARPLRAATLTASVLLPAFGHSTELLVHWLRGTEALAASIAASVSFTVVATAFNLHAMRHGVLTVGAG